MFGEEFSNKTYFLFFLQIINVQSDDVRNVWIRGSSYGGDNSFKKLFTQKILNKEGQKQ